MYLLLAFPMSFTIPVLAFNFQDETHLVMRKKKCQYFSPIRLRCRYITTQREQIEQIDL